MTTAQLLRDAADDLEKGGDPFCGQFLDDHHVTFDQCMTLATQLALGARIVAKAIEDPKSPQGIAMVLTLAEG
jgi:hypothetical protein